MVSALIVHPRSALPRKDAAPPQARAAIARSRLWYANKLLAIDDSQWMSNPVMARIVAKPRKSLSLLVLLLYVDCLQLGWGHGCRYLQVT